VLNCPVIQKPRFLWWLAVNCRQLGAPIFCPQYRELFSRYGRFGFGWIVPRCRSFFQAPSLKTCLQIIERLEERNKEQETALCFIDSHLKWLSFSIGLLYSAADQSILSPGFCNHSALVRSIYGHQNGDAALNCPSIQSAPRRLKSLRF